jgi:hypothetical protein
MMHNCRKVREDVVNIIALLKGYITNKQNNSQLTVDINGKNSNEIKDIFRVNSNLKLRTKFHRCVT